MSASIQITRDNLIERLQKTVPDFSINPDWRDDNLGCPIINDLARFICDRAGRKDLQQVRTGVEFLEMGLECGDEYVRDLVAEALEILAACRRVPAVQPYFGPRLLHLRGSIRQGI